MSAFMLRVGKTLSDTNNRAIADSKARILAEREYVQLLDINGDLVKRIKDLEADPNEWMEHF